MAEQPKFQGEQNIVEQYATKHRLKSEGLSEISIGDLLRALDKMTPEKRKEVGKIISDGMRETHMKMLNMAIDDKFITKQEIEEWKKEFSVDEDEISQLIRPYYEEGLAIQSDKKYKHRVYMVTMPDAPLMRMKKMAAKRFNIGIITITEANKRILAQEKKKTMVDNDEKRKA